MKKREIDPLAAIILYESGHGWTEIGRILAASANRRMPFLGVSVYRVVRAHDRQATIEGEASTRLLTARS